jgi:hypothetical protein
VEVSEFRRLLHIGLGRTVLYLQNHDSTPYRDVILEACKKRQFGWMQWGNKTSEEDLLKAAQDLLKEENPKLLLSYLDIFRHRPFPLDFSKLVFLAQHDDERVPYDRMSIFSLSALENITHPDVRALALKMIAENNRIGRAVGLLQRNFEDNDWKLLESITVRELERDEYHSLGMSIEDIFKINPSPEAAQTFLNVYERCPCSQCRRRFVEILHSLNALPVSLLEECKFDANFDLREQVENGFIDIE